MIPPYLTAYESYLKADRELSWTEALDFHFQKGAVISTPRAFVMARRVSPDDLNQHADPDHVYDKGDTWHVWVASGDLSDLLTIALFYEVSKVTFQRRGQTKIRSLNLPALQSLKFPRYPKVAL